MRSADAHKDLIRERKRAKRIAYWKQYWVMYAMLALPVAYYIIFRYIPMAGNILAFRRYVPGKGMFGTQWTMRYVERFLKDPVFWKAFKNTLGDIPDWCTVVFTYETVAWKPDRRLKKLWDPIQACGQIVDFEKQNQRELVSWVSRHFLARGKRISNDLCAYLIEITDGTMTSLSGEINKIVSYSGADEIRKSDIDAVTEPVLDAVVFQMTDLLSEGNYGQALVKLHQLLKMQQEPIQILGAVGGHFRRISTARTLLDHGRSASELAKLYGIQDYPARKSMEAARKFRPAFCKAAAELVLETDRKMKTSYDEPERLLEMLILQLAQEAKRG